MSNDIVLRLCRNMSIGLFIIGLIAFVLALMNMDTESLVDYISTTWATAAAMATVYFVGKRLVKKVESEKKEVEE